MHYCLYVLYSQRIFLKFKQNSIPIYCTISNQLPFFYYKHIPSNMKAAENANIAFPVFNCCIQKA